MSSSIVSTNPFAPLQPEAATAQNVQANQPAKGKREFSIKQIIEFEERQVAREAKAAQAVIDAAKEEAKKKRKLRAKEIKAQKTADFEARQAKRATKAAQGTADTANPSTDKPSTAKKPVKEYTKKETEAYEERKAHRAAIAAKRAEDKAAYEARCRRREEKATYEERCLHREQNAAYEVREAKRQAKAKKIWITECLRRRACFNCGSEKHFTNDCPDPPYEGKY